MTHDEKRFHAAVAILNGYISVGGGRLEENPHVICVKLADSLLEELERTSPNKCLHPSGVAGIEGLKCNYCGEIFG